MSDGETLDGIDGILSKEIGNALRYLVEAANGEMNVIRQEEYKSGRPFVKEWVDGGSLHIVEISSGKVLATYSVQDLERRAANLVAEGGMQGLTRSETLTEAALCLFGPDEQAYYGDHVSEAVYDAARDCLVSDMPKAGDLADWLLDFLSKDVEASGAKLADRYGLDVEQLNRARRYYAWENRRAPSFASPRPASTIPAGGVE